MPEPTAQRSLIAVDVGNSRVKWGLFRGAELTRVASMPLGNRDAYESQLAEWLPAGSAVDWSIASVNPDGSDTMLLWLRERAGAEPLELSDPAMLPIRTQVEDARAVGIDRLLDAVAANARRPSGRPAIIVDAGSAITVDLLASDGTFLGGAIAAGLPLAARALYEFTYYLPHISVEAPPAAVGTSTPDAMRSGLFWGTVGSINELVRRMAEPLDAPPVVFLTGGDSTLFAASLERPVELVPELTLHGIYLATRHGQTARPPA